MKPHESRSGARAFSLDSAGKMKKIWIGLLLLFFSLFCNAEQKTSEDPKLAPEFKLAWGNSGQKGKEKCVAIDEENNIYIGYEQNIIEKFDSTGKFLMKFGDSAAKNKNSIIPQDIAVNNDGLIFVTDSGNDAVQVFNANGTYQISFGEGQLKDPEGIAVDNKGCVYIVDCGNNRIQKFYKDGKLVLKWGKKGTGDGQFDAPIGIVVDKDGYVYVTDTNNFRIQKFDKYGKYIGKRNLKKPEIVFGNAEYNIPRVIAISSSNILYAALDLPDERWGHGGIAKFSTDGKDVKWNGEEMIVNQVSTPENSIFKFIKHPAGIAVDKNDYIYVIDSGKNGLYKYGPKGGFSARWISDTFNNGQFNSVRGVAVDDHTNTFTSIYAVDGGNSRIQKFDSEGNYILQWGGAGKNDGLFSDPETIAVDKAGYVYVVDEDNKRIQKFDSLGKFILSWDDKASYTYSEPNNVAIDNQGNYTYFAVWGIAVDGNNNVYVSDSTGNVQKFDSNGKLLGKLPIRCGNMAIDNNGNIYTSGAGIKKYDSKGKLLLSFSCCFFGTEGQDDNSECGEILGVALDKYGNIYVSGNNMIAKFSPEGKLITQWGSEGRENGQFTPCENIGIAVDDKGAIYASDSNNNRIQKFQYENK